MPPAATASSIRLRTACCRCLRPPRRLDHHRTRQCRSARNLRRRDSEGAGASARTSSKTYKSMVSRAYHDSLFMARIAPVAMLFIPCRGGVSHRPDEYASPQWIGSGVHVLARTLANWQVEAHWVPQVRRVFGARHQNFPCPSLRAFFLARRWETRNVYCPTRHVCLSCFEITPPRCILTLNPRRV